MDSGDLIVIVPVIQQGRRLKFFDHVVNPACRSAIP